ncbi:kinectin [Trichonephila clavipes]|nr:kinectin [Trichonephila clavipes]
MVRERIGMSSEKMKTHYNARATGHDFYEGDKVWLWNLKRRKGMSPKLQTNWEGPYTVLKRLNGVVVRIQKSPHSKPKDSLATAPVQVQSISPLIFRSTGLDSSGGQKGVALQLQDARVGVGSNKDADRSRCSEK